MDRSEKPRENLIYLFTVAVHFETENNCTTYFWECKKPQCGRII